MPQDATLELRVIRHPILGDQAPAGFVEIIVDGRALAAREGETIAAALLAAGIRVNRYTPKHHEPRGLFCAIGQCTDCVMVVNGIPNVRTCVTPIAPGMKIETQRSLEGR